MLTTQSQLGALRLLGKLLVRQDKFAVRATDLMLEVSPPADAAGWVAYDVPGGAKVAFIEGSDTPAESHVFMSAHYKLPIHISAGGRVWSVSPSEGFALPKE